MRSAQPAPTALDDARRAELKVDMPRVPLSSLRHAVAIPERVGRHSCAHVLLWVQPYGASAAEARGRGWPFAEIADGKHLEAVRRPPVVTDALLAVELSMEAAGHGPGFR